MYFCELHTSLSDSCNWYAGLSGIWGVLFVGLLAKEQYIVDVSASMGRSVPEVPLLPVLK